MTMKRILLLFLLFCGGYVHAQELDSVRIYYRQGHREVDVLFRDNRAELERFIRILREEYGANRLESVVVRSWSSPEGVNHLNEVLSDRGFDTVFLRGNVQGDVGAFFKLVLFLGKSRS